MWPRVIEAVLGCWILMSPFIFGHSLSNGPLWHHDLLFGTLIVLLALLSFWRPLERAHLLQLVLVGWLITFAFLALDMESPMPARQNHVVVALLLSLFAVLPNHASEIPREWQEFLRKRG